MVKTKIKCYIEIRPDEYKIGDNLFKDDIEFSSEKYHHIIDAESVRGCRNDEGYIDWYKGIWYKPKMWCHWEKDSNGWHGYSKTKTISGYKELDNANMTNLVELQHYGCKFDEPINIMYDARRQAEDTTMVITMRVTNTAAEEELTFNLNLCTSLLANTCQGPTVIDSGILVPPNSFLIYRFRYDGKAFYLQKDDFSVPYSLPSAFKGNDLVHLYLPVGSGSPDAFSINSYVISTDIFRYVLATSGHVFNYCQNYICYTGHTCTSHYPHHYCRDSGYDDAECYWVTECSLLGCIPGAYCNDHNICQECDKPCRTCFDGNLKNCKSCYSTARYPQWKNYHQFQSASKKEDCIYEFYPLNKIESNEIEFPIPLNYRLTFEFWMFIHEPLYLTNKDLTPSLSSFILKDFFTVSIHQDEDNVNNTYGILTPFEFYYPFSKDFVIKESYYQDYLKTFPTLQYLKINLGDCRSKWIYVKGGISYTHNKMFLNDTEKDLEPLPYVYGDDTLTYRFLLRKYYRKYDKTSLKIQGFQYLNTDFYVRNLNFYSEYMKGFINGPNYFNMHTVPDIVTYPQLLFSIPFDDVIVDSEKVLTHYTVYDYSGQFTEDDSNQVFNTSIESIWVRDYLAPSKNFYRLNFLKFENKEYSNYDLSEKKNINCPSGAYCFCDNSPYVCPSGQYLLLHNDEFLNDTKCVTDCIDTDNVKYMKLPNIKKNKVTGSGVGKEMCVLPCNDTSITNCPSTGLIKNFQCSAGCTSYFYQCLNNTEYPPYESALEFSGTMKTKTIVFPFNRELSNFMIEIWFHPDILHQENPPVIKKYIFMTDNHLIYYDVANKFTLSAFIDGIENTFPLGQKIYYYGWNHLIFYSKETINKGVKYTTFSLSITNNFITIVTVTGIITANKLCICIL